MMFSALALLAVAACALASAPALTSEGFKVVLESGAPVFVKFYAPWCGHCKRLTQPWDDLAAKYNGGSVKVVKIDCTVETEACSSQGIRGYPTLKFFKNGQIEQYSGARTPEALSAFIDKQNGEVPAAAAAAAPADVVAAPAAVVNKNDKGLYIATDATFKQIIAEDLAFVKFYAPWCGHCKTLAPVWDQLAEFYANNKQVKIVKVDCTVEKMCNDHSVKGFPTLILFKNGAELERYKGGRTLVALTEFTQRHLAPVVQDAVKPAETVSGGAAPAAGGVEVVDGLKVLTQETFVAGVANGYTIVKFYAPWCGHCKRLAPVWDEYAKQYNNHASFAVAKVDCTLHNAVCSKYEVRGYPTILLFKNGNKIAHYKGGRDLGALETYAADTINGKHDEL